MTTTQKESWIKTVIQAIFVSIGSAVVLNVGDALGTKLNKVIEKLDKIETHETRILSLETSRTRADSLHTIQSFLNDNRQKGEWALDRKVDELAVRQANTESNVNILFDYVKPK